MTFFPVENIHPVDVSLDHHRMVGPLRGNGIVVGVEAHQGQGRCRGGLLDTGVKRCGRQRPEMGLILVKKLCLGGVLAPQFAFQVLAAFHHQLVRLILLGFPLAAPAP